MNRLCTYCGKWFPASEMTPLFEKGNPHVCYYCEQCLPDVKFNIRGLPWYKPENYRFGYKGE